MELILGMSGTDRDNPKNLVTRCPRCGYDQRGVVESWKDACPLKGLCSECGLEIEFAELLSSKIRKPKWNVEYGSRWVVPWRTLLTLLTALWPSSFWRSLKMTHRPRWRRLILFFALLFGPLYLALAGSHGLYAWRIWKNFDQGIAQYNVWNNTALTPVVNPVNPIQAIGQFILMPFSDQSLNPPNAAIRRAMIWTPGSWDEFPSPRDVLKARLRLPNNKRPVMWIALFPMFVLGLYPLGFMLIPISRKIAKVQWLHIVRISIYSLLALCIPLLTMLFNLPQGYRGWYFEFQRTLDWFGLSCFIVTPLALFIWWRYATVHYLKMPHARGLAFSVLAMSMLLLFVSGYFSFCLNMWTVLYLRIIWQY
ncbi:MAG: hypothetical protein O7G85_03015 [Planctomycetota bacterium]|nr:hypothetical protein [Planctomycetota bacterium]